MLIERKIPTCVQFNIGYVSKVIERLAGLPWSVDMKFPIHIHIYIYRFDIDIHGYNISILIDAYAVYM